MTTEKYKLMGGRNLLVPIKVQALVIEGQADKEDAVLAQARPMVDEKIVRQGDFKWSPLGADYAGTVATFRGAGPSPFFGADTIKANRATLSGPAPVALPKGRDRGIYLHWILPPALRRACKHNTLDYPPLPDQWLVLRFARSATGNQSETKAWFIDASIEADKGACSGSLLELVGLKYQGVRFGKVVEWDKLAEYRSAGQRTKLTALGNQYTGSPMFTASVADNRNMLSWHDDLRDIRDSHGGLIPVDTAFTYFVAGWYLDAADDPLRFFQTIQEQPCTLADFLRIMDWNIDLPRAEESPDFLVREGNCLFHGMVAHINFWNPQTYRGPMLGYPGAPSAHGGARQSHPPIKIGIGNSAEDALVALVADDADAGMRNGQPALWKALESVMYRQPLKQGWDDRKTAGMVHQNGFMPLEAGQVWAIAAKADARAGDAGDGEAPEPTTRQWTLLKLINDDQAERDALVRELAALQQELYASWWSLGRTHAMRSTASAAGKEAPALAARVKALQDQLSQQRATAMQAFRTLPEAERKKYTSLSSERLAQCASLTDVLALELQATALELRCVPAPRFWTPADPVIVVKNSGESGKHEFSRQWPCRLLEDVAIKATVTVDGAAEQIPAPASDVIPSGAKFQHLTPLIAEAAIVEHAVANLAMRTLQKTAFKDATAWNGWKELLDKALSGAPGLSCAVKFASQNHQFDFPLPLLWGQQPWSPLLLDWQISWHPLPMDGWRLTFGGNSGTAECDYRPGGSHLGRERGYPIVGRSMLMPMSGDFFQKPLAELERMLTASGVEHTTSEVGRALASHAPVWQQSLAELKSGGLLGQSLSGLHQCLAGRDVTRPRVQPGPYAPWDGAAMPSLSYQEMQNLLCVPDGLPPQQVLPNLAPPRPGNDGAPFDLNRAGYYTIDHLWIVDDFGQWVDLLQGSSAGRSSGLALNPHVRWPDSADRIAMPPRILQPARLAFQFADADEAGDPVCGWVCYNHLDQALALCDRQGKLLGELMLVEEGGGQYSVVWECLAYPLPADTSVQGIVNAQLRAFAEGLLEEKTGHPKLWDLLALAEQAQTRHPPATTEDTWIIGRPLALVQVEIGLELYGKAWKDPARKQAAADGRTGDAALDAMRIPVKFGSVAGVQTGCIGYYSGNNFERIIASQALPESAPGQYVTDQDAAGMLVRFGASEPLVMLIDPHGSVQASTGLLPAHAITLPTDLVRTRLAGLEMAFHVQPVLGWTGGISMPVPFGNNCQWLFQASSGEAEAVAPFDPKPNFDSAAAIAVEGRLILRQRQ